MEGREQFATLIEVRNCVGLRKECKENELIAADDKKGRKEVVKQLNTGNSFNVLMINQQLQRVRELASAAKSQIPSPPTFELTNA